MKPITLDEMSVIAKKLQEEKADFICRLKLLLKADTRSRVESLKYIIEPKLDDTGEKVTSYEETINVNFKGSISRNINITGCSCGAIYREVGRVVYE